MQQRSAQEGLTGLSVAVTGRLVTMTHVELAELVRREGGEFVTAPNRRTGLLVVGQDGLPLDSDGQPTRSLQTARRLQAEGYPIEVIQEDAFLARLGLIDRQAAIHRRYTLVQLSRLLDVSRAQLRTWMRAGLIWPVETVHRLAYFDYPQVARARMLSQFVRDGLNVKKICTGLEQLRRWFADAEQPLGFVDALDFDGALLVRLENGAVAELSGQLRLDFDDLDVAPRAGKSPPTIDSSAFTAARAATRCPEQAGESSAPGSIGRAGVSREIADRAFEEALYHEDAGDFAAAATAYEVAIEMEPDDAVLHFNLGNVVYLLGDQDAAIDHFQLATALDPNYVEAWNNLGNVLGEQGSHEEAVRAFRRALSLVPHYADAHFNLADVYLALGCTEEARDHWSAYLKLDSSSPWAEDVRQKLTTVRARKSRAAKKLSRKHPGHVDKRRSR